MIFKPLHYGDRLLAVNPAGTVGITTLWSRPDYIADQLRRRGVDLSPETSSVALMGNLFGEGLRFLLRNLLYNPQIDTLVVLGNNISGSAERLEDFFAKGIEPIPDSGLEYQEDEHGTAFPCRIVGSNQILDNRVAPECYARPPRIWRPAERRYLPKSLDEAAHFLRHEYRPSDAPMPKRVMIAVPQIKADSCPSDLENHGIIADTIPEAWNLMLRKICRFGKKTVLAGGAPGDEKIRYELRNFKAVVLNPHFDEKALEKNGLSAEDIEEIRAYRAAILDKTIPPDQPYTYGNRLRDYFRRDFLDDIAASLRVDAADGHADANPDNRKNYVSLWDSFADFEFPMSPKKEGSSSKPCLATVFFRKDEGKISLTACFRTHNASNAWIVNAYGLAAIQEYVCSRAGAHPGSLTVISFSLGLDPKYMEKTRIRANASDAGTKLRQDPNGYIEVRTEDGKVVVEHKSLASGSINVYTAEKREEMFRQLTRDDVFSQLSHALYAGAEIGRAFACLKSGEEYLQDNA